MSWTKHHWLFEASSVDNVLYFLNSGVIFYVSQLYAPILISPDIPVFSVADN